MKDLTNPWIHPCREPEACGAPECCAPDVCPDYRKEIEEMLQKHGINAQEIPVMFLQPQYYGKFKTNLWMQQIMQHVAAGGIVVSINHEYSDEEYRRRLMISLGLNAPQNINSH